jgi:predicted phosphodiesterase
MAARFPDCRVVVFGHSHQPLVERSGGLLLLNPGSAVDRRREPVCTMAILDVEGDRAAARLIELPDGR